MKSLNLRAEDFEKSEKLLRRIYKDTADSYKIAIEGGNVLGGKIFSAESNTGVLIILRITDFIVSYISFETDPEKSVILAIEKHIEKITSGSEECRYININGENLSIIQHFENGPYTKDRESVEYIFSGKKKSNIKLSPKLERKEFDEENFEDYIWLLDTALRPLLIIEGQMLDPYRRNVNRSYTVLTDAAETGDFGAYWKDDSIVALYLLRENLILDLVVNPIYQNQGIGSAILSDILATLMKSHSEVLLYVSKKNAGAMRFYEKMGFKRTASNADFTYSPPKK
ncbi:MAG: GNAT family N-acetyltransferase [Thermoplasmata archaeon]|nr:GNAT family N-acetyltransferase [Thermoplasmata archaeon]